MTPDDLRRALDPLVAAGVKRIYVREDLWREAVQTIYLYETCGRLPRYDAIRSLSFFFYKTMTVWRRGARRV